MALSERTKTTINASRFLDEVDDDFYPHATVLSATNPYSGTIRRINPDDIPTTTQDMSRMFKWEHGNKVYGTHAKDNGALKRQRRDINRAYGNEDSYLDIYIDTLLDEDIGPRLEEGDM